MKNLKLTYQSYSGGGGPTNEQSENNTLYFGQVLQEHNIKFQRDRKRMLKLCGIEILSLKITYKKKSIYVGYDRWGYVVECDDNSYSSELDTDQCSVEIALQAVKQWRLSQQAAARW